MTLTEYVDAVLAHLSLDFPNRDRIEQDLRSHIEDRVKTGMTEEEIIQRMGSPSEVAASFETQVVMAYAPYSDRLGAFLIDVFIFLPVIAAMYCLPGLMPSPTCKVLLEGGVYLNAILVLGYFPISEYLWGRTVGKACFNLQVRSIDGGKITIVQAFLRRITLFWLNYSWLFIVDAGGALISPTRQRLTDMLARTVVVQNKKVSHTRYRLSWALALLIIIFIVGSVIGTSGMGFSRPSWLIK